MKGINEEKSEVKKDMNVVNLPSKSLKARKKMQLEGKIRNFPEAQRVAEPQINAEPAVAVSQAEIFFVRGANTTMKINGAIAGDSATGRKKFTVRQWAALIGICGVETWKQVQKNWREIKNAHYATEVRTIVVTAIKEQKVDVDRHSNRV